MKAAIEQIVASPYPNPECHIYSPATRELIRLSDVVLARRKDERFTSYSIGVDLDAKEIHDELRSGSFRDMILPNGYPLASRYGALPELVVSEENFFAATIRAHGTQTPPDKSRGHKGSWKRQLALQLWYKVGELYGGQELKVADWDNGTFKENRLPTPDVYRYLYEPAKWGRVDYHSTINRPAADEKSVLELLGQMEIALKNRS